MSKEDHLEWLGQLEGMLENPYKTCTIYPKREGAFYFGEGLFITEYVERYREACKQEGWL